MKIGHPNFFLFFPERLCDQFEPNLQKKIVGGKPTFGGPKIELGEFRFVNKNFKIFIHLECTPIDHLKGCPQPRFGDSRWFWVSDIAVQKSVKNGQKSPKNL